VLPDKMWPRRAADLTPTFSFHMKVLEAAHSHCVAFIQAQDLNTASWLVKIRAHACAYQNAVTKPCSARTLCIYYVRSSKKRRQNDYAKVYIDFLICSSKQ